MDNPEKLATRRGKTNQKHNTICVSHHYTQTNTNNVNKTWALLQTAGGKEETNIVFCGNRNGHHNTGLGTLRHIIWQHTKKNNKKKWARRTPPKKKRECIQMLARRVSSKTLAMVLVYLINLIINFRRRSRWHR